LPGVVVLHIVPEGESVVKTENLRRGGGTEGRGKLAVICEKPGSRKWNRKLGETLRPSAATSAMDCAAHGATCVGGAGVKKGTQSWERKKELQQQRGKKRLCGGCPRELKAYPHTGPRKGPKGNSKRRKDHGRKNPETNAVLSEERTKGGGKR